MKIAGTYTFPASVDEVWAAINDPEVLARSIPGCQKLDQVGEHEFESTLKIGLQAVKGVYSGRVKLDDLQPPNHYRINIDGKGSNGFLKGTGTIDLEATDGDATKLTYSGDAQIGGTIASVGQRLIDGASKTLINQSLKALAQQIEQRKNGGPESGGSESGGSESGGSESGSSKAPAATATQSSDSKESAAPKAETNEPPLDAKTQNEDPFVSEAATLGEDAAANLTEGSSASETVSADLPSTTVPAQQTDSPPPATTTLLSTNPMPPRPKAATAEASPSFQPRSIVVPEGEQLSETAVMQGMVTDFINERPWLPWVFVAFLLGFLAGRR